MKSRARSVFKSRIARGAAIACVIAAGACNALVGLDDLEHVLTPSQDSGAACSDPIADCPAPEGACEVPVCGQDGSCGVAAAPAKTACSEGSGVMCSAAGECVECVEDIDCAAPLACGGGGVPGACGCEAPCHVWSKIFGGPDQVDFLYASNMAVHPPSGDVLLTGWFKGSLEMGKSSLTSDASEGKEDGFLVRLDPSGSVRWAKRFSDPAEQLGFGVAATKDGDVLATGGFQGALGFDGMSVTTLGSRDAYVARFSGDGALTWLRTSTGDTATIAEQFGIRLVEDAGGNIIVMGHFAGGLDFGDFKSSVTPMDAPTNYDVFVVKFGPTGDHKWTKVFGNAKPQRGPGLAVDAAGNIVLAGVFAGAVEFGGGLIDAGLGEDIYVVKLNPDGGFLWGKYYGNDQIQNVSSLHVDKSGAALVAIELVGTVNFGGGAFTSDDKDAIVLKLNGDGSYAWSRRFGGAEVQGAQAAIDDGNNGVLVTGRFDGVVDFGMGPVSTQSGSDSVFLLKLDAASGATVWSRTYGMTGVSAPREIALDASGHAILFGSTNGTIDFGGGPLVNKAFGSMFLTKFKL